MFNRLTKGKLLNVVAIHSKFPKNSSDITFAFYEYSLQWMSQLGVKPKSISFLGFDNFDDATFYPFETARKKLHENRFEDIPCMAISAASVPDHKWLNFHESKISSRISSNHFALRKGVIKGGTSLVWCWENTGKSIFFEELKEFLDFSERHDLLDYAFAFSGRSRDMPEIIEATSSPFQEKSKITWSGNVIGGMGYPTKNIYERGMHPRDFLRDIYPYQILSPIHLSYKIEGVSLREWINSSIKHGELVEFCKERWLWSIDEKSLNSIRKILIKNNLLTIYLSDLSRAIDLYAKPNISE